MYYVQGVGYIPVNEKHLPKDVYRMVNIELLDLLIFKINDKYWIQKNYKSGTIRIIIKTTKILDKDLLEKECLKFDADHIKKVFDRSEEIIALQNRLVKLFEP